MKVPNLNMRVCKIVLFLVISVLIPAVSFALSKPPTLKEYITKDVYIVSGTLLSAELVERDSFVDGAEYKLRINASVGAPYPKKIIKFHMEFSDGGMGVTKPAVGEDYIFFIYKKDGNFEAAFLMIIKVDDLDYESKAVYGFHELLPSVDYFSREGGTRELVHADEDNPNLGSQYDRILYEYSSYLEYLKIEYQKLNK